MSASGAGTGAGARSRRDGVTRALPRRPFAHAVMVVLCYLAWTAVFLGVAGGLGLLLVSEIWSGGTSASSSFQVLVDSAGRLIAGSVGLTLVAGLLSYWIDRHVD